jgi:hypothetical protein
MFIKGYETPRYVMPQKLKLLQEVRAWFKNDGAAISRNVKIHW